jgi:hypothetical protein
LTILTKRLTLALAAVAAGGAIAPAAQAAPLKLGFMDPAYQAEQPARFWADAKILRPQVLRYNVDWRGIAPRKPTVQRDPADPRYDWAYLDDLVQGAAARRIPVVLTIHRTPGWAAKKPSYRAYLFNAIPNTVYFRNFVAAAALRYSGRYDPDGDGIALPRVSRWQIWNEPNKYLYPVRTDRRGNIRRNAPITIGRDYSAMLNGAYAELKRRSRTNIVVAGGTAYSNFYRTALAPVNFLRLMKAGGARFDVLAIHPYNSVPTQGIRQGTGSKGPNIYVANFGEYLRAADRLWPRKRYKVWLTEFGIQSYPDRFLGVPQAAQAAYLRASINIFKKRYKRVEMIVWFLIRDEVVRRPDGFAGWQSGLRTVGGKQKPAWRAWLAVRGR